MNSLSRHIDGRTVATELRMRRQVHKGGFVLLEGSTDIKRLKHVLSSACELINCSGRRNVVDAIEQLYEDGFPGVVGLVDADFDRLTKKTKDHEGLCLSESHDFDLDMICTPAFARYLHEVADPQATHKAGGPDGIIDELMNALYPLSTLRYINEVEQLGYSLSTVLHDEFFDDKGCDIDKLVASVSQGKFSSAAAKAQLKKNVTIAVQRALDKKQITSGHDFCAALGIALRARLGKRKTAQTYGREVELHLRLAYRRSDFEMTRAFAFLADWQRQDGRYKYLA